MTADGLFFYNYRGLEISVGFENWTHCIFRGQCRGQNPNFPRDFNADCAQLIIKTQNLCNFIGWWTLFCTLGQTRSTIFRKFNFQKSLILTCKVPKWSKIVNIRVCKCWIFSGNVNLTVTPVCSASLNSQNWLKLANF